MRVSSFHRWAVLSAGVLLAAAMLGCSCHVDRCGGLSIRLDCGLEIHRSRRGGAAEVAVHQSQGCTNATLPAATGPCASAAAEPDGRCGLASGGAGLAVAEPQQDVSKFHPVPTRPVFSPALDDIPPEPPPAVVPTPTAPAPPAESPSPEPVPKPPLEDGAAPAARPRPLLATWLRTRDSRPSWLFASPGSPPAPSSGSVPVLEVESPRPAARTARR